MIRVASFTQNQFYLKKTKGTLQKSLRFKDHNPYTDKNFCAKNLNIKSGMKFEFV